MSKDDQKMVHGRSADRDIKRGDTTGEIALIEHRATPPTSRQNNDWSILFDALDAFEPDLRLERDQPNCGK